MFFPDHLEDICHMLKMGGVIIYPTDTVWGIGCDPFNAAAVERIYEIKQRKKEKSFVLLVDSIPMLKKFAPKIHPRIETLLVYHSKPLTLVHTVTRGLPDHCLAEDGSVAIRIAQDPFCQNLIAKFGNPIISSSVNRTHQKTPKNFSEIDPEILKEADYVVRYRRNEKQKSQASVIASYNQKGALKFLRI